MKRVLLDFNLGQLEALMAQYGQPRFRAEQIFCGLNKNQGAQIVGVPRDFLNQLEQEFELEPLVLEQQLHAKDKSSKVLYKLCDGNFIESVIMQYKHGNTVCVSTQVGCRMNCAFCASGIGGLVRNLSAGEILAQVVFANKLLGGNLNERKISNVVLMGSGEPLDNFDNVVKFVDLVNCKQGLNISTRSISLSTCGLVDKIYALADMDLGINLSLSLHATCDEVRNQLIPVSIANPIDKLAQAVKYYFDKSGRRVYLEYILIKNKNMQPDDAMRLKQLFLGISFHVNLIMLNPVKEKPLTPCTQKQAQDFLSLLTSHNISATLRRSLGSDIEGACGQLRNLYVGQKDPHSPKGIKPKGRLSSAKKP